SALTNSIACVARLRVHAAPYCAEAPVAEVRRLHAAACRDQDRIRDGRDPTDDARRISSARLPAQAKARVLPSPPCTRLRDSRGPTQAPAWNSRPGLPWPDGAASRHP